MCDFSIPGITLDDIHFLVSINIKSRTDLQNIDPDILFLKYCLYFSFNVDRQKLYFYRAICFYAKYIDKEPNKIKWS